MSKASDLFDEKAIRDILSASGLVVGDLTLDFDNYMADVYIEINAVGLYSPKEIENIVKKINELESLLMSRGFIHNIKFGDIYMGKWRILIHFIDDEDIKED